MEDVEVSRRGVPFVAGNEKRAEVEAEKLARGGFFFRARVRYKFYSNKVYVCEGEVKVVCAGDRYINPVAKDVRVLYFFEGEGFNGALHAVSLKDLIDLEE